jgi:hypothetical protein
VLVEPVQAEEPEAEAAEVGGQEGEEPPVEAEEAADEDEEGSDERDSLGEGESEERDEYEDGDEGADDVEYDEEGFLEEDGYGEGLLRPAGVSWRSVRGRRRRLDCSLVQGGTGSICRATALRRKTLGVVNGDLCSALHRGAGIASMGTCVKHVHACPRGTCALARSTTPCKT